MYIYHGPWWQYWTQPPLWQQYSICNSSVMSSHYPSCRTSGQWNYLQIKQTTYFEMIIQWKIISDFSAKTLPSMYGWLMSPSLADHLIIFTQNQFQSIEYQKCTFSPGSLAANAANGSWMDRPYNSVWFDGAVSANWPASDDHQRFCDLQTKGEECWTTIEHPRSLRSTHNSLNTQYVNTTPYILLLSLKWPCVYPHNAMIFMIFKAYA